MKKLSIAIFVLCSISVKAQQNSYCGQYQMEQEYLQQHPEVKQQREALEKFTADYTSSYYLHKQQDQTQLDTVLFVIPVVFHVMHNYGSENISKLQILDAMRIINEDYQKRNADTTQVISLFQPIIGDAQVEFRLAQLDPQGNCTDGITRHQTILTNGGDNQLKTIVQWPPDRYLNIWVENSCSGNFVAYSQYPGIAPNLDGVVIMDEYVGSIGTSINDPNVFRVLSHEIGHYLNLKHVWGDSNTPGLASNCNVDDMVFDTPNTIGSSYNCNLNQSTCTPGVIDNVQNIMDYSSCDYMFTQGQCARMQAALNSTLSNRNNLWSAANRLLTGTNDSFPVTVCSPIADFSGQLIRICEGESITYNNVSYGGDFTAISWQFTGGSITASTDSNPTVQYNNAGIYDVILTVTNSAGTSTLTRNALVQVSPAVAVTAAPIIQDFESIVFPSNNWNYDSDAGSHWEQTTLASVSGIKSLYIQADSANMLSTDVFYTDNFNLSNLTAPVFNFKIAFASRAASTDNLKIFMSTDCGQTWILKYTKSGSTLETVNDTALNFIPLPSNWRQDALNISAAAGQPNVKFKFQFTYAGGNNLFIDDININGTVGLNDSQTEDIDLSISPNPTETDAEIKFTLSNPENVTYCLTNVTGQKVLEKTYRKVSVGEHIFKIKKPSSTGMYFCSLLFKKKVIVKKVVFR